MVSQGEHDFNNRVGAKARLMSDGGSMGWGIAIGILLLGGIYNAVKECLLELRKISMHSRAMEEVISSINSNIVVITISLDRVDSRLANVEATANLAYDRLAESRYSNNK
jgi:hypothetical protein